MVANNKEDFLFQLHNELHRIGIDADEDIFSDFEEHFKASANIGISEEETCRRLGDVKEIARNYLSLESARINSLVAREVEQERPRVSLTKAGQSVPADLSLKTGEAPAVEITPEHISEEIYPDGYSERQTTTSSPQPEITPEHIRPESESSAGGFAAQSMGEQNTQNAQNAHNAQNQSLGDALGAAGKAVADAAVTAGHAIADAFNREEVKAAGHAVADAVKNAGQSAAEVIKDTANNLKKNSAGGEVYPNSTDEMRANNSADRKSTIPPQHENTGSKGFHFTDVKGMKMNPNAGKLFTQIMLDVFLWSWLITMLGGIAIGLITGGGGLALGALPMVIESALSFQTSCCLLVLLISLGLIILMLGVLLIKGIVGIIKNIVMGHVKALYDL
ncbi:MAG: hypothetical protein ACI4J8_00390 [Oscillospiraceae bacterium]